MFQYTFFNHYFRVYLLLGAVMFFSGGCRAPDAPLKLPPPTHTVEQLQTLAAQTPSQVIKVHLQGAVVDWVPLAGGAIAYELQDSTGRVWVISRTEKVERGSEVSVQGTLRTVAMSENLPIQGRVYVEQASP